MDYRIISLNNGDSMFCIVVGESDTEISVLFPMILEKHVIPLSINSVRETYSASQLCPFTDERHFTFYKPELLYIKPLSKDAIPFYVNMINKHETIETMRRYNISNIIDIDLHKELSAPETSEQQFIANLEEKIEALVNQMEDEPEDNEETPNYVKGNRVIH